MASIDLFPSIALGDALDEEQAYVVNMKCETAVTKGQVVIFNTHTASELPSVSTAGALATNCFGVALKSGAAGAVVPVLARGIVKVTASGGITGGVLIVADIAGQVQTVASNTFEKVIGRALQTFLTTDTGLAFINCER